MISGYYTALENTFLNEIDEASLKHGKQMLKFTKED